MKSRRSEPEEMAVCIASSALQWLYFCRTGEEIGKPERILLDKVMHLREKAWAEAVQYPFLYGQRYTRGKQDQNSY